MSFRKVLLLRDKEFLSYRSFNSPDAASFRVAASIRALVASREMGKPRGRMVYLMEAFGRRDLNRLTDWGTELVLCYST